MAALRVLCWALIFILRLRFPPGSSIATNISYCNHLACSNNITQHTRVKTHKLLQVCKQVVTSLFTSCQQVVFARLVPSLL